MTMGSPHIAALALGVQAVERGDEFEAALARLFRAREDADREARVLEAARMKGRGAA